MKLIILDNGHGQETKGKRSPVWPDGTQLLEWEYNRKVVDAVYGRLMAAGISCVKLVPEKTDTPLSERVRRANGIAAMNSISQVLLVSVHVNAAPVPGSASGWEIHTSPGQTKSDEYAQYFWNAASRLIGGRFPIRGDWEDGEGDRDSREPLHGQSRRLPVPPLRRGLQQDCGYPYGGHQKNMVIAMTAGPDKVRFHSCVFHRF